MRPWARQCESNGRANLFMILAVCRYLCFFLWLLLYCLVVYAVYDVSLHLLLWNTTLIHVYPLLSLNNNKEEIICRVLL